MRNTNQNQTKFQRVYQWTTENRTRSSLVVFALIVTIGSTYGLATKLFNGPVELDATGVEIAAKQGEVPGWWFNENFGASVCEQEDCLPSADPDKDKLSNYQEYFYSSDPKNTDTNANGNTDGEDVAFGFVPNKPGKVTFTEAGSDETILGESLAYNDEVKQIIVGMTDYNKVLIPEINELELNVLKTSTRDDFVNYILKMNEETNKYTVLPNIADSIKQQDPNMLDEIKRLSASLVNDYKNVDVPADAVQLHKYHLALWQLMPMVAEIPTGTADAESLFDEDVNEWYDSVQAMISLNQKIIAELNNLRQKHSY